MTKTTFPVFKEINGYFRYAQSDAARLQNHFGSIFPAGGCQVNAIEGILGNSAHATMNVAVVAFVDSIEDPSGQRGAKVSVKGRHCVGFDGSLKP